MDTYSIGQAAERSGFSVSALRYYEGVGLMAPPIRTDSGYRLYDDGDLARLMFISRAKKLGCSLSEITDLVDIWDGEPCGLVQRRFHHLVTTKVADAEQQILELSELIAQLRVAAGQLVGPPSDGSCGEGCACLTATTPPASMGPGPGPVPIACTLDAGDLPGRLEEWRTVLGQATSRTTGADRVLRMEFAPELPLGDLAGLVAAEQRCCAFFSFAITVDHRGIGLEVSAPEGSELAVLALFGAAAA